jgi:SAM-dependent methyltransferase
LSSPEVGAPGDYWSSVVDLQLASGGSLWRTHSDEVNGALLEAWIPSRPSLRILKTDLFDEAVSGGVYPLLAASAADVVGIDVSPTVVGAARARYPGLEARVADVRELPFPESTFDVVVSISTLDHFESLGDVRAALAELRRVLVPGGELLLTLDNGANPVVALRNRLPIGILQRLSLVPYFVGATCGPRSLRKILGECGFEVRDTSVVMHCPRVIAVLGAQLLEQRAGRRAQTAYLRLLRRFELLGSVPTRSLTGYFVAARATPCADAR